MLMAINYDLYLKSNVIIHYVMGALNILEHGHLKWYKQYLSEENGLTKQNQNSFCNLLLVDVNDSDRSIDL